MYAATAHDACMLYVCCVCPQESPHTAAPPEHVHGVHLLKARSGAEEVSRAAKRLPGHDACVVGHQAATCRGAGSSGAAAAAAGYEA
jgi:hypothetical protein